MTREEVIARVKHQRDWANEVNRMLDVEAFDMAIKALEQEPILEKDGTLIVTTDHYENVGRVLVQYGTNGTLFYQDREPTAKNDAVLNKIRAEIEQLPTSTCSEKCRTRVNVDDFKENVLKIFDKYKAESEDK